MTHFLQSPAWARFQEAYGRTVVSDTGDGWSYQGFLEKGKINSRIYVPYGPEVASAEALDEALASLKRHAEDLGATFIRIEPTGEIHQSDLEDRGLHRTDRVQPEVTSIIDLSAPEKDIIARMSANTRNLHRTYKQKGLSVHESHNPVNIAVLTSLLHEVEHHTGMHGHSDAYLQKQADVLLPSKDATLYNVTYENRPIVAALVYDTDTTRYYAHAAAGYKHRKLNAGTILVSQMIIDAKKKGLRYFDLCGIWPTASEGSARAGITRFKRSFGGDDVRYNGTWELPVKPLGYKLYRTLAKATRRRV